MAYYVYFDKTADVHISSVCLPGRCDLAATGSTKLSDTLSSRTTSGHGRTSERVSQIAKQPFVSSTPSTSSHVTSVTQADRSLNSCTTPWTARGRQVGTELFAGMDRIKNASVSPLAALVESAVWLLPWNQLPATLSWHARHGVQTCAPSPPQPPGIYLGTSGVS